MHIGHYISGAAHAGLIGWVLLGGAFTSKPPPMEVTEVSIVTAEDFERVLRAQRSPATETEVAVPVIPEAELEAPGVTAREDTPVTRPEPEETEPAEPDTSPDLSEINAPEPRGVADEAPVMIVPETETAVVVPEASPRPEARPVPRVAPEPVAQPKPDTTIADELQEATRPDESGETAETPKEETAPEAATTEIVTEPKAEEVASAAPSTSLRPRVRPAAQPAARPEADTKRDAALQAALAEAQNETGEPARAPSGPPLTAGEKEGLKVAVQKCWVVDVGSRAADVTVTVGLSLDQNGRVQGDIQLIASEGGDEAAVRTAFQAARRAVLRCQKSGYDLPKEKYDHWRDVEITFNPEQMRRK